MISYKNIKLVVFTIDDSKFALELSVVERVVPIVEIKPLPAVPKKIVGVINYHGTIIPVINIREMFGFRNKEMDISEQIILAKTTKRLVGIITDLVENVIELEEYETENAFEDYPFSKYVAKIVVNNDELIIINDLEKFLSLDDHMILDAAIDANS